MAVRSAQNLIAVTALLGLAACGTVQAAAGHQVAAQPLCAAGRGADHVAVNRIASPHQVTVSGATQVRAMVAALCALPPMPAGRHCPAADSVLLVFTAGERSFPPVTVQESGCRGVTGLGATRSWSGSTSFGRLLDEAAGGLGRLTPGTHPSSVPFGP